MTLVQTEPKKIYLGNNELKAVYLGENKVRPAEIPDYLCFTAEQANSTISLTKWNSPSNVNLEISNDMNNWTDYTIGNTITLSNVGDKVYWRNKSETPTSFSTSTNAYYYFQTSGLLSVSGNVNYLLCKKGTDTLSDYCFYRLFYQTTITTAPKLPATTLTMACYQYMFYYCNQLTTTPELPATTLAAYCYENMFAGCTKLTTIPKLQATTLATYCYQYMFYYCPLIKLSKTQTGAYQTAYRIPTEGTGTTASNAMNYMFNQTGGTFAATPSINTTYYTSNTVV